MRQSGMKQQSRPIYLIETASVPRDGLLLGWAATVPFFVFAIALWLADASLAKTIAAVAQLWGGAIMLFFSGVRRGLSFRTEGGPHWQQLVVFGLLFFGGLAVLTVPPKTALFIVAVALAALAIEDTRAAHRGEVPLYFSRLRPPQMSVAAVMTLLCWWAA